MNDSIVPLRRAGGKDFLLKRHPGSISLRSLVDLLVWAPIDANPHLRKVSSVVASLEDIIDNDGEVFVLTFEDP